MGDDRRPNEQRLRETKGIFVIENIACFSVDLLTDS